MKNFTEKVSNSFALYLSKDLNKSSEEVAVLKYGIFVFIHTFMAVIFTIIFGIITNTVFEMLIISLIGALMKRCSGGVHSSSPNRCITTGIIVSYVFVLIAKVVINLDEKVLFLICGLIFAHSFIILYKKCPVPSENKPLKKEETRKRLRKKAFSIYLICIIIFILNIIGYKLSMLNNFINFNYVSLCIVLGLYMQTLSLTFVGSKLILLIDKLLIKIRV